MVSKTWENFDYITHALAIPQLFGPKHEGRRELTDPRPCSVVLNVHAYRHGPTRSGVAHRQKAEPCWLEPRWVPEPIGHLSHRSGAAGMPRAAEASGHLCV